MTPSRTIAPAIALAIAVAVVTVVCLVNGARRVGRPFPGFLVAENRTVLSVAREGWSLAEVPRAAFSQVIAVDGRPVTRAEEIESSIAARGEGTPVTYRLRKGSELFTARAVVQRFSLSDLLALHGTYALLALVFAIVGVVAIVAESRSGAIRPAVVAFFVVCQGSGLTFGTSGDLYGPYWFTPLYFIALSLVVAGMIHLGASFPQPLAPGSPLRRAGIAVLYLGCLALAAALVATSEDPSLFLPLLYVLYLLLANAIFVYAARLAIGLSLPTTPVLRSVLRRALAGVGLVVLLPVMIFLVYPAMQGTIPPLLLVGPFAFFPLLTWSALRLQGAEGRRLGATSVRLRVSLLFLAAVETSFLIAVAVFWQNHGWAQLLDERALNQRQQALVERLTGSAAALAPRDVAALEGLAQTEEESDLVRAAAAAAERGDAAEVQARLSRLRALYAAAGDGLEARHHWIASLDTAVLATLLAIAVLQAALSMLAVRRWLIGPIDRIAGATKVIATGDLDHRIEGLEASEEFESLARSVNAMAASLASIGRRVEAERAARQRAAGAARDAERRRLARELHDGILQDLSAVRLRLEAAAADAGRGAVRGSMDEIGGVIAAIRRVVDDLRPSGLGELSLEQAIAGHARVLAFAHGVRLSLDLSGAAAVPDWAMRDVYRIAQEATANALRHGAPSELAIRLAQSGGETMLEVADDGAGFDPDSVAAGSGLHGMRERAAALGGDLEIEAAPGRGSTIRVVLRFPVATA